MQNRRNFNKKTYLKTSICLTSIFLDFCWIWGPKLLSKKWFFWRVFFKMGPRGVRGSFRAAHGRLQSAEPCQHSVGVCNGSRNWYITVCSIVSSCSAAHGRLQSAEPRQHRMGFCYRRPKWPITVCSIGNSPPVRRGVGDLWSALVVLPLPFWTYFSSIFQDIALPFSFFCFLIELDASKLQKSCSRLRREHKIDVFEPNKTSLGTSKRPPQAWQQRQQPMNPQSSKINGRNASENRIGAGKPWHCVLFFSYLESFFLGGGILCVRNWAQIPRS